MTVPTRLGLVPARLHKLGPDPAYVTVTDHEGNTFDTSGRENIALCRCGASSKRPFCDGTHRHSGWQASETAPPTIDGE